MIPVKQLLSFLIIAALFSSCASSYRAVKPSSLNFANSSADSIFSYKYDVLRQAKNKQLSKKEDKTQIRVLAIKITNNTMETLKYGHNYNIYSGIAEAPVLPVSEVALFIKQPAALYLLYLLLTPARFTVTTDTKKSVTPIGVVIGPALAVLNMGIASGANKKFRKEMEANSILDKEIKTGETVCGMIGIRTADYAPLTLKIVSK